MHTRTHAHTHERWPIKTVGGCYNSTLTIKADEDEDEDDDDDDDEEEESTSL